MTARGAAAADVEAAGPRRVIPRATYRLQLHAGFPFAAAAQVAPYLARLGVSHVYSSPYLQAAPGSTHGYDVVDPRAVNRELGGEAAHAALSEALGQAGLGQVLDVVPNHMAIGGPENPWWWDVLENGPASRYAGHFDVDWTHPEAHLRNRVLLPVLDDHYGRVLERGDLRLEWDRRRFTIRFGDRRFPVAPPSLDDLLRLAAKRAGSDELAFLADAYAALPPSSAVDLESIERRHRDKEVLGRRLTELAGNPVILDAIDAAVAATNADVDALDRLLERQNYRLAWWTAASRDLGYRRFFDVSTLAGVRAEDERVFQDTHGLVLDWLAGGVLDGVRIDHPDGLLDPEGYLRRLRWASPRAWVVVEKILEPGESLRRSWPVAGTTGYDFVRLAGGLWIDPDGVAPLRAIHAEVTGEDRPFVEIARTSKAQVLREVLGSELGRLTALLLDVAERHRRHRDHTRHVLHEAIAAILVAFPVYRTYVRVDEDGEGRPTPHIVPEDEAVIATAVTAAIEAHPELPPDLLWFIADLLRLRITGEPELEFTLRFQQLTGPVMAKGVEDTAFYRDLSVLAANEVGGDPANPAVAPEAFHAELAATQERWPSTMLAGSTHDTKRGEDVRARLAVLTEIPDRWRTVVAELRALAAPGRSEAGPDGHAEYLALQTIVGAWPIAADRLNAFLVKALREAKLRTSWGRADEAYEAAVTSWAAAALADEAFRARVEAFVAEILRPGRVNGLAQTLLRLTAPGVPDLYQGSELWSLTLVDPDNRRPVDFALRERLLAELETGPPGIAHLVPALDDPADPGRPKLALIRAALGVRRGCPDAFGEDARYRPLVATGRRASRILAFARSDEVVTVVPRLTTRLGDGWGDTTLELPAGRWRDELSGRVHEAGGPLPVADLLEAAPVALLTRAS
ncbi:MAG TPA: malto-oligosyltrehalose synthase [Candidatus Limnocylindrales bacterium]|nr:malto-oligosyltrehalose synthase [Candidatus Limnocylindrales bacterium]